jgi:hypothetical protein
MTGRWGELERIERMLVPFFDAERTEPAKGRKSWTLTSDWPTFHPGCLSNFGRSSRTGAHRGALFI